MFKQNIYLYIYIYIVCLYVCDINMCMFIIYIYTHPHKLSIYSMYTSQGIQKIHGHIGTASDRPAVL